MIFDVQSTYMIIQYFIKLFRLIASEDVQNLQIETSLNQTVKTSIDEAKQNSLNSTLIEKIIRRYKRAPMFPGGFPYPGSRAYPRAYPEEYAYPPGHGYGHRPYPPSYTDYMEDNRKRDKALQKFQGLGYITNQQMAHMVMKGLYDFIASSTLGQYHLGGKPLDTSPNNAVRWLQKKVLGYAVAEWSTTKENIILAIEKQAKEEEALLP